MAKDTVPATKPALIFDPIIHRVVTPLECLNAAGAGGLSWSSLSECHGPPQCHAKGERILLFDGATKAVEDVVVGDLLMGPDSKSRRVISTHTGNSNLYRVVPNEIGWSYRGPLGHTKASFVVSGNHILHLNRYHWWEHPKEQRKYVNISVRQLLEFNHQAHLEQYSLVQIINDVYTMFMIKQIEDAGIGDYYGFEVEGDHLYLDEHYYVHHNSSKTTFCMQTMQLNFAKYGDQIRGLWLDSEGSADELRMEHIFGLTTKDPRLIIEPAHTIELAVSAILHHAKKAKEDNKFLLVVWDSISTSVPKNEYDEIEAEYNKDKKKDKEGNDIDSRPEIEYGNSSGMMLKPRVLGWAVTQMMRVLYRAPVCILTINQATSKKTMWGFQESSGGGYRYKHNIHYSLNFRFIKGIAKSDFYNTGSISEFSGDKSKFLPPGINATIFVDNMAGGVIHSGEELITWAKKKKLLQDKSGGWYKLIDSIIPEQHIKFLEKFKQMPELINDHATLDVLRTLLIKEYRETFTLVNWLYLEQEAKIKMVSV